MQPHCKNQSRIVCANLPKPAPAAALRHNITVSPLQRHRRNTHVNGGVATRLRSSANDQSLRQRILHDFTADQTRSVLRCADSSRLISLHRLRHSAGLPPRPRRHGKASKNVGNNSRPLWSYRHGSCPETNSFSLDPDLRSLGARSLFIQDHRRPAFQWLSHRALDLTPPEPSKVGAHHRRQQSPCISSDCRMATPKPRSSIPITAPTT